MSLASGTTEVEMKLVRITVLLIISVVVAAVSGCATISNGPTPTEQATAALTAYHIAEQAQDVEGMLAAFSEDFSNSQGANKSMLRGFIEGGVSMGMFSDLTIDMEKCKIRVNGDAATAGPVTYRTPATTGTYSYRLKIEPDGVWRIINSEIVN